MSILSTRCIATAAAAGLGLAALTGAGSAAAATAPDQLHVISTLSTAYVGPLQFAVGKHVYVADSFTSTLNEIGRSKPIAVGPSAKKGGDIAGVAVGGGAIAYTSSTGNHKDTRLTILRHGHVERVVSLSAFEAAHNPDGGIHYGVTDPSAISAACKSELKAGHVPVSYTGEKDSHPYAVAWLGDGAWAVADAGGNDVLKVDSWGHVSVLSVLPAQPVLITAKFAAANKAKDCVGLTYAFEPVPTDVEVGPNGALYVTTLPGGPEGPDNGNPGSVYELGGQGPQRIATGFSSATNLAIAPDGRIFVAELAKNRISVVCNGVPQKVASLKGAVAVEWANGHLYASSAPAAAGGKGPGKVVVLG